MPMQPREPRNPFKNLLPLVAAAVLTATAIVACDRPASRSASPAERFARTGNGGAGEARAPAQPQSQAASPSPATAAPIVPSEALTDTVITGKIKAALLADPAMGGAEVSVNTDRGVVVLTGLVKSQEQTAIASAHAQRQDGVLRVDNHLTTQPQ